MIAPGIIGAMVAIDAVLALAIARDLEREGLDTKETQAAAIEKLAPKQEGDHADHLRKRA